MTSTDFHGGTHRLSRHLKRTKRIGHTWQRSGKKRCYWIEKYLCTVNPMLHKSETNWVLPFKAYIILYYITIEKFTLWSHPRSHKAFSCKVAKSKRYISAHFACRWTERNLYMWWYHTDLFSD